ncbi:unnamed protein product [Ostreobium quekettii]|uniref:Uncharacterized protein n=1 Tax=Ostreobium quekettii TaxID=121088 RepID=A0A8S1J9E5_9CHLO|nr:unnamed protein product [Ostreobium quekettii]|eukprot:evm.model.scf_2179.3 EVM.evm.TU.scf_2179.3   scf_2179:14725-16167(-)
MLWARAQGWWLLWTLSCWLFGCFAEGEQQRGGPTVYCNNTGPCIRCTEDLQAHWDVCSQTGYFRPARCSETPTQDFHFKLTLSESAASQPPNGSSCLPLTRLLHRQGLAYKSEGMTVAAFEALMIGLMIISMGVVWCRKRRGY